MNITSRVMALAGATEQRYRDQSSIREKRQDAVKNGNIWGADDPERVSKRLMHVQLTEQRLRDPLVLAERTFAVPSMEAVAFAETDAAKTGDVDRAVALIARERTIGRDDLVAPRFLKLALAASRCVCRITARSDSGGMLGYGTGMLVGPGILLTNHHVLERLEDAANSEITFGFEADNAADERLFRLDPKRLFLTDEELDFTFVAVAEKDRQGRPLADLGYISLNQEEGKAINGEYVNVIQHPNGGPKMFALRENRIVDVLPNYLHYVADTAPGSSGAPVFNDQFELVALHHSGVAAKDAQGRVLNRKNEPWTEDQGEAAVQWKANEGVRVSVLAARARERATPAQQALFNAVLDASRSVPRLELASGGGAIVVRDEPVQQKPRAETAATVSGDMATWTIPLTVSVRLGDLAAAADRRQPPAGDYDWVKVDVPKADGAQPPLLAPTALHPLSPTASVNLQRAVDQARDAFKGIAGIVRVRPGWQFADGWITDKQAIVVVVEEKKTSAALEEGGGVKLPGAFAGYPIDVRQASAEELYELHRVGGGLVVEERTGKPTYKKPPNLKLPRVKEHMKVKIHVSPDYGWPTLRDFLGATDKSLTVAMYDFTAPHIIKAIKTRLKAKSAKMQLVLQYGASLGEGAKAEDIDDAETVKELGKALGKNFKSQWANVGQTGSLWASAYHIKVAVRDSRAFWLSSGNWQSSNQAPDAPPADKAAAKTLLQGYNREWHAVVENETLAKVFEAYIKYDFQESLGFTPKGALEAMEILPPLEFDDKEADAEIRTFEPLDVDREVDVQAVLTPDNYFDVVMPLIESAKSRLYFQNQYIHDSADPRAEDNYVRLLEAIAEKQDKGIDVRIILRSDTPVEARHIEFMKTHGIDMNKVRWRRRTHTKGIIVDSARVLLGSHNWSFDGTVLNRDASLLFYDAEIAKYLEKVFLYDWENWSKSKVSIIQKKPKVNEIASAAEMANLLKDVATTGIRARRLFHPADD